MVVFYSAQIAVRYDGVGSYELRCGQAFGFMQIAALGPFDEAVAHVQSVLKRPVAAVS